jgi:hypothetical protein
LIFLDEFSTVDDFLKKARAAKHEQRQAISDELVETVMDPSSIGIPPALHSALEDLVDEFGDEPLRQTALFCLTKWFGIHAKIADNYFKEDKQQEGCAAVTDAARISSAIHLLQDVGSFSGDEKWRSMLCEQLTDSIMDELEDYLQ